MSEREPEGNIFLDALTMALLVAVAPIVQLIGTVGVLILFVAAMFGLFDDE